MIGDFPLLRLLLCYGEAGGPLEDAQTPQGAEVEALTAFCAAAQRIDGSIAQQQQQQVLQQRLESRAAAYIETGKLWRFSAEGPPAHRECVSSVCPFCCCWDRPQRVALNQPPASDSLRIRQPGAIRRKDGLAAAVSSVVSRTPSVPLRVLCCYNIGVPICLFFLSCLLPRLLLAAGSHTPSLAAWRRLLEALVAAFGAHGIGGGEEMPVLPVRRRCRETSHRL